MVDLNDMVIFAKVAETGGITAAAKLLKVPKSKVSRRLAQLEATLEVQLLERSTRSMSLTESGQLYLQHCQRIVEEANSAQESIHQLMDTPRGHLRIGASVAIGQYLLAPYLAEFAALYPEIEMEIELNNRRVDLINEGYDLVVRVGQLNDSNLISKRFGSAQACLYASTSYLKQWGEPVELKDLTQHKTIIMSDANSSQQWVLENDAGVQSSVAVNSPLSINDFSCLRTVVENGAGIAHFPKYLVEDLVQQGKLKQVLTDWRSPKISYYVLYPSRRGLTRKARAWIEFFEAKFKLAVPND